MKLQPSGLALPLTRSLHLSARRVVILLALGLLTVILLLALGGGRQALTLLAQADWRWIGLAVIIHYSGFAVRGWRWQGLLATMGHRRSWRSLTTLLLSGWFLSALLPARAGDVMRVGVLRLGAPERPPIPVADALGSLVLERALDLLAILLLGLAFAYAALRTALPVWVMTAYAVGVGGLLLLTGTLLLAPALMERLHNRFAYAWWNPTVDFLAQLIASLRSLGGQPLRLGPMVLASLYIWLCDGVLMWLVVHSLGEALGFARAAFVALTVDVFATVPLTPGAVGQIEAVNAALLAWLQLPEATVAAVVLINRAISYWTFLLFSGLITLIGGFGQLWLQPTPADPPGEPTPEANG
jgi:glycosyltransferase AglD